MSSSDEYKPIGDTEDIWKQTSKWRPVQLEILKIEVKDGMVVDTTNLDNTPLYVEAERILLSNVDIGTGFVELPDSQIPFYNRLTQLSMFRDEPPVDSIAHDLLTFTGFETRKLHFRPKPHIEMEWRGHEISSEADYGVYSERSRITPNVEYLVIVEDKPEKSKLYSSGECQLSGEMLVAAIDRYQNIKKDHIVYGMILRGSFVRLYKCVFRNEYLSTLTKDKYPASYTTIHRYPSESQLPLSLNDKIERKTIVQLLSKIRIDLEQIA
jgi:hypothetical protein